VKQCWAVVADNLKIWLQKEKTNPQLVEVIVGGLQGWYSGADLQSFSTWPAFLQQCNLGWQTFLEGGLSGLWQQEQDNFWKRVKTHKSSKQWTLELIKNMGSFLGSVDPPKYGVALIG